MSKTTTKKLKIIGTQNFINPRTGEIEEFQVTSMEDRDFNFTKVWLDSVLSTLNLLGNAKTKVAYHIIDNLNYDNQYIGSQRVMAERCGVSVKTVTETIRILLESDFLRTTAAAVYSINPNVLYKGSHQARLNVLHQYNKTDKKVLTDEEKIANLKKIIDTAQAEIAKLQYKVIKPGPEVRQIRQERARAE